MEKKCMDREVVTVRFTKIEFKMVIGGLFAFEHMHESPVHGELGQELQDLINKENG